MINVESVDGVSLTPVEKTDNSETQTNPTEEKISRCHNCVHYLPSYNVCRMTVSDIKFVKGCTAYDPIIKNKE